MKMRCLLLYCMPYSLVDENTGNTNEGISTTYLPTTDLVPIVEDNGAMGIMTCKQSLPSDWIDKLTVVPGIYDIDFKMKSVGGKPVMTPIDIAFVSGAKVTETK